MRREEHDVRTIGASNLRLRRRAIDLVELQMARAQGSDVRRGWCAAVKKACERRRIICYTNRLDKRRLEDSQFASLNIEYPSGSQTGIADGVAEC